MSEAHDSNDSGIQHFSASQTSDQIAEALSKAYPDKYEYEKQDFTTAPLMPPADAPKLDADGKPIIAAPDPAAPVVTDPPVVDKPPAKPGKRERALIREAKARDLQLEETRRELAELKGIILGKQSAPAVTPTPAAATPVVETVVSAPIEPAKFDKARPKREEFFEAADPEVAYEDAVADWKLDSREFARTATEDARKAQEARESETKARKTATERWDAALAEARSEHPDFEEVTKKSHFDKDNKPLPIISNAMGHVARNSKMGPKIIYWLGTHPEEANKIAVKTVITDPSDTWAVEEAMREVRREFDRIEQELAAAPKPPDKTVKTETPAAEVVDEDLDDEEDDELEVDPNLQPVGDSVVGKKVDQPPAHGTVDTQPQATPVVQAKPEPVDRVRGRSSYVNKPLLATPPDVLRTMAPDEYRNKRKNDGSVAARG